MKKPEKKHEGHLISAVIEDSIAHELEVEPGDVLLSIDGHEIEDIFDYRYLIKEEELTVLIRKRNGEEWELDIEKDADEDLGIEFENGLMDDYRSCANRCMFCFIDQMPRGMRQTLYFKDDDARLSFLQGNYITLTNLSDHDIDRIIRFRLSPVNISFHTTDPELRCRMLGNRFAGEALVKARRLCDPEDGVDCNGQIVLCRGINDGDNLTRTLEDLMTYRPRLRSVSVVPVGLTRYREGLYPLEPFDRDSARDTIERIRAVADRCFEDSGRYFVHAADEWYLLAGEEIPPAQEYDEYEQLENGVGMLRLFTDSFHEELESFLEAGSGSVAGDTAPCKRSMASGLLMEKSLRSFAGEVKSHFPRHEFYVYGVVNEFFGERITVSGLLTGRDIVSQLRGRELGEELILPSSLLRSGEEVLLDDMTLEELSRALGVRIRIVSGGAELLRAMLGVR